MMKKFTLGVVDMQEKVYSNSNNDKEIHILSSINDPLLDFKHQLSAILDAWRQVAETEYVKPVFQRFYLSDIANQAEAVQDAIIGHEYPASMIQQAPANGTKIALWAIYMTNAQTKKLEDGLFQVTSGYGCFYWSTCMTDPEGTPEEQTDKIMRRYIRQLEDNNMTLAQNCLRTWFYVNDIDNNYHGMVVARNKVFSEQGLTSDTHFIASTGIGGRTANMHALVTMEALAVSGVDSSRIHYLYALDRLNRTSEYGVSFERGTFIDMSSCRKVFISGTASIDNKGRIVFEKDVLGQAKRMMGNIEALLKEGGCCLGDVQEAVVYLRDLADYQILKNFFDVEYPDFPHLIVLAHVCRPGWLIETECMAMKYK